MITTYNDFLSRWCAGFRATNKLGGEQQVAAANLFGAGGLIGCRFYTQDMPAALPPGVTSFIPTNVNSFATSAGSVLIGKLIKMAELDIAGPTFTHFNAMPSLKELGVVRQVPSAPIISVKTALNATPGNLTFTYLDQDGNSTVSTAFALAANAPKDLCQVPTLLASTQDTGVIDITDASRTSGTTPTGVLEFFGMIPITRFTPIGSSGLSGQYANMLIDHINIVRLGPGDVVGCFSMIMPASMTGAFTGSIDYVGDN